MNSSSSVGMTWTSVDTPYLAIDLQRLDENIQHFHSSIKAPVQLRSHIKTHKSPQVAKRQLAAGACGIAAAKISEAAVFVDAGCDDVVIAYPIFGASKWRAAAELASRCERFVVHVENAPAIVGLSEAAGDADTKIGVRIEIDSGFHRTGVDLGGAKELAKLVESLPNLYFDGITTHRSAFFPGAVGRDPYQLGVEEGQFMVEIADELRRAGHDVANVAAGSTPTAAGVASVEGITEVCAGTYVLNDAGMAAIGVVDPSSIAISVVATVVVAHKDHATYTVDAGAKTFTKDRYPGQETAGFGVRTDRNDRVVSVTDEHGIVASSGDQPDLGEVLGFYPMHACPTVNAANELFAVREGQVVDVWPVAARGMTR